MSDEQIAEPNQQGNCPYYPACFVIGDCDEGAWQTQICGASLEVKAASRQAFSDELDSIVSSCRAQSMRFSTPSTGVKPMTEIDIEAAVRHLSVGQCEKIAEACYNEGRRPGGKFYREEPEHFQNHMVGAVDAGYSHALALVDQLTAERDALQARCDAMQAAIVEAHRLLFDLSDCAARARINVLLRPHLPKPKPDPLVELARELVLADGVIRTGNQQAAIREGRAAQEAVAEHERRLRAALAARGGSIVFPEE